jgi:hypothetical protein
MASVGHRSFANESRTASDISLLVDHNGRHKQNGRTSSMSSAAGVHNLSLNLAGPVDPPRAGVVKPTLCSKLT